MVALNLFRGKEEGGVFINQRWTLNLMCMVKIRSNPRVWRLNPPCLMVNHVVKFRSQLLTFFHWQTWAKHEVWQPDLSWNFCLCWIGVLPIWKCSLVFFRCHFGVKQETQTKGFLFPSFTSALKRPWSKSSQLWWLGVFQNKVKLVPKWVSSHLRSLHMTKNMCSQVQRRGTTIRLVPTKPTKLNSQAQVQVPNRKFRVDMCFLSTPHNPRTCMLAPKTQKRHCNRKSLDKLKCLCTRSHHAWRNWNAAKTSNAL